MCGTRPYKREIWGRIRTNPEKGIIQQCARGSKRQTVPRNGRMIGHVVANKFPQNSLTWLLPYACTLSP